jgi:hypothetical protein
MINEREKKSQKIKMTLNISIYMRNDRLTMVYFENLDNGPLNKYKKS